MKSYELTYITSSATTPEDAQTITKEVEGFIQGKGGVIVKSAKSDAKTLAYPIKKQGTGYFTTLEFQVQEADIKEIKKSLDKESKLLRHFLIVKEAPRIMKERRTRRPMLAQATPKSVTENSQVYTQKAHKEEAKIEDIDTKLDQMLSE